MRKSDASGASPQALYQEGIRGLSFRASSELGVIGPVKAKAGILARAWLCRPYPRERQMKVTRQVVLVCAATLGLGSASVQAGPCNTSKTTEMRDAGSGPTPGNTGSTVGANSKTDQHPPTSAMNQQSGNIPASSEDAQKQMQGKPTAAQQADGAKAQGSDC